MKKSLFILPLLFSLLSSGCASKEQKVDEQPVDEQPIEEHEELEGLSPEEAVNDVAICWGGSSQEVEDGVFGAYGAFPSSSYSVEDLKSYVSMLFVPEEFELVSDWTADEQGVESCSYINAVSTVLEFYVYAETLYVDADGYIVEEGTEGATSVEATCVEVYGYTYVAEE